MHLRTANANRRDCIEFNQKTEGKEEKKKLDSFIYWPSEYSLMFIFDVNELVEKAYDCHQQLKCVGSLHIGRLKILVEIF